MVVGVNSKRTLVHLYTTLSEECRLDQSKSISKKYNQLNPMLMYSLVFIFNHYYRIFNIFTILFIYILRLIYSN
jgi:hypothetical protein